MLAADKGYDDYYVAQLRGVIISMTLFWGPTRRELAAEMLREVAEQLPRQRPGDAFRETLRAEARA